MKDDLMIDEQIAVLPSQKLVKRARDLNVYRRAYVISLQIHQASLNFPKIEQYALRDQLRRSSKSICANIAEGFVRQRSSTPEFARFLLIAEASAEEVCVWLEYAKDLKYITAEQFIVWDNEYLIIASMLSKFRKTL